MGPTGRGPSGKGIDLLSGETLLCEPGKPAGSHAGSSDSRMSSTEKAIEKSGDVGICTNDLMKKEEL
jgi:hypothetical protein